MKAQLDGVPLPADRPTLTAVLGAASARAREAGRVIVEVSVDGEPVSGDLLADPPETDLTGRDVTLTSAQPRELVRETLRNAAGVLQRVRERQGECAGMIQQGALDEAFGRLSTLLGEWQMVQEALVGSSRLLGEPVARLAPRVERGEGVEQAIETLGNLLQEVKGALGREDWAALSDVLAYDLSETAEAWSEMLEGMADHLEREEERG